MGAPVISASPSAFGVPTANLGVSDQLSAHEISRSPEARCGGPVLVEARERSLIASPTFLPVLAVSPPSFPLRLQFRCLLDVRPMQAHRTLHSVELNANNIRAEVSVSWRHDLSSLRGRSLHSAFAKLAKADRIPRLKRHFHFGFGPAGERANLISRDRKSTRLNSSHT